METNKYADTRLIEAGFPCHQVGAETQRERGASSALPPLYFLHVWWARRPLTPSRAAILGSLLPADTNPEWFLRQLGIACAYIKVDNEEIVLNSECIEKIVSEEPENEMIIVDQALLKLLRNEKSLRLNNMDLIQQITADKPSVGNSYTIQKWMRRSKDFNMEEIFIGQALKVYRKAANPAWFKELMSLASSIGMRVPNMYGYDRAYYHQPMVAANGLTILDPTAGGGSIPFEALRLGHHVISNDLNPVASMIQYATLDYPARFGEALVLSLNSWGSRLFDDLNEKMENVYAAAQIPDDEYHLLKARLKNNEALISEYRKEEAMTFLYVRQVVCPHCGGEAPLMNTCWLSKEGEKWGVRMVADGKKKNGAVRFEPYRMHGSHGPNGEDPDFATVGDGVGTCIHCRQAVASEEIKAQARGESVHGTWKDRLFCVVAVRYQPKIDKNGQPERFKSGEKAGQIKTEKIRYFRAPNQADGDALAAAEKQLSDRWEAWDAKGYIPTERFPEGNDMRPVNYGMARWCDMFTPRQLLGHLFLVEKLNEMKPEILRALGEDKGRAVVTYLQFMLDKGLDYNSRQTRWEYTRGIVKGTFGRHDFSLKWTFGEMIFSGPNSGARWGMSQVIDAYEGIAKLTKGVEKKKSVILNGSAANLDIQEHSVDLICMDPPYYNNVQYAELSDYFYVWHARTLKDLYPDIIRRRLTNKLDEAVANPVRDGSAKEAAVRYEQLMKEIFAECRRVLKDTGIMTLMFTHKTQEAWETLTRSLIESGWRITASFPVDSEAVSSIHQKDMAAAASSIFITCRKRAASSAGHPSLWSGFGGTGVAYQIREAVRQGLAEFEALRLNPVDEMVASYGRALRVLSENWPVMDGDEQVSPIRAMTEASAVVAQSQIRRLTQGRLGVDDLHSEAAMALTLFGIYGMEEIAYSDVLNLSKSLNIRLEGKSGGYLVQDRRTGINDARSVSGARREEEKTGFFAPLVKKGSKLRLAAAEERAPERLENPQTEWDILQGILMAYEEGQEPVARAYLQKHAANKETIILDLLKVWASECGNETAQRKAERILYSFKR